MGSSGFSVEDLPAAHWAAGRPAAAPSLLWASGGLWSTATDFGAFVSSVLRGDSLSPALHKEIFRPQVDAGFGTGWGLGWGLCGSKGAEHIFHFGFDGTYRNYVQADPAINDMVVILTNGHAGLGICRHIVEDVRGWQFPSAMIEDFFARV